MSLRNTLVAVLLALIVSIPAAAADTEFSLKSRQFTPESLNDPAGELIQLSGSHVFVQLDATPNAAARGAMAASGLHLLTPLSGRNWIAWIDGAVKADFAASGVRWVGKIRTADKIDSRLAAGDLHPHSVYDGGRRVLEVAMHKDVAAADGRELLQGLGAEVLGYASLTNTFVAAVAIGAVDAIAQTDEVLFVAEAGPAMEPLLDKAAPAVGADVAHEAPYSVTGAGVTAFILDGGTISANGHPDLAGRVTVAGLPIPDIIGHPTHVGCIVGGNGSASSGQYTGMAPEVNILSSSIVPGLNLPPFYNSPGNLEGAYRTAVTNHGATVSNNSIGANLAQMGTIYCDYEGDYEGSAQVIDAVAHGAFGPITIVWANGNERGHGDGACGTTYFTTAPPAPAKNPIAVGAMNKDDLSITQFTSYGPTDDGRIRPDVMAPGCAKDGTAIMSCTGPFNAGDYQGMCGTSMASPVVAGSVALLQEYWVRQNGAMAGGATFKALVIHGADERVEDGPDFRAGYGNLNVPASLDLIDTAYLVESELDQGETFNAAFEATGDPVRATVVWMDPQGPRLTAKALVNDLDLFAVTPDTTELPWILDPGNPDAAAAKGGNHRDPVERLDFESVAPGDRFEVFVSATEVPEGPQAFTLIVTGGTYVEPAGDDDDDAADDDDSGDDDAAAGDDDDDDDDDGCGC